jgi:hypothetical protein
MLYRYRPQGSAYAGGSALQLCTCPAPLPIYLPLRGAQARTTHKRIHSRAVTITLAVAGYPRGVPKGEPTIMLGLTAPGMTASCDTRIGGAAQPPAPSRGVPPCAPRAAAPP